MIELEIKSLEDTKLLAEIFANVTCEKLILTLSGDLGAGKTTFTKFFASFLGVKGVVTSPTFNIMKEYSSDKGTLYHIDAYRLEGSDDDLGFFDIFYDDNIVVIEWAEFIKDFLPKDIIEMKINLVDDKRVVTILGSGEIFNRLESEVVKRWQL